MVFYTYSHEKKRISYLNSGNDFIRTKTTQNNQPGKHTIMNKYLSKQRSIYRSFVVNFYDVDFICNLNVALKASGKLGK